MTLIDNAVTKLFGYKDGNNYDLNSNEFMKKCIKDAPNVLNSYYEYTSDRAIKDFLFEQTDLSKELKKIMEQINDTSEEKNT